MICYKCKEQIEVGEACSSIDVGGYKKPAHIGCSLSYNPVREIEDAKREDEEFERIANQARLVC